MYYTRKDLLDRKWELTDIQAFDHDAVKKSETGRGRPSYLYLISRVDQKEKGLTVDASELAIDAALKLADANDAKLMAAIARQSMPIESLDAGKGSALIAVCSVPQAIREPASTFAPYVQVNGTVEISKTITPIRQRENPNAVKLDLRKLPKGPKVIVVDSEGNETLYQDQAA